MQSTNNKIKTEPKVISFNEEVSTTNNNYNPRNNQDLKTEYDPIVVSIVPFQERETPDLSVGSDDDTQDLLNPELRNEIRALEGSLTPYAEITFNNTSNIKLSQGTRALSSRSSSSTLIIKQENEDYVISPEVKTENSSEQSSYCQSEASTIPQESGSASQRGSNTNANLEEDLEAGKREKTLIIQLNDGTSVTLTNSKKATRRIHGENKSEFQLYENQVELWQDSSRKAQQKLRAYNSQRFKKEIGRKCYLKENLGLILNNNQRIILREDQALNWARMEKEEQDSLKGFSEEAFFERINKKYTESQSKTITINPNNGQNIEVVLSHNQLTAWNKLSKNEQENLKKLEKKEFIDEINKKVNVSQSKTITLTSNNGQNIEVVLSARQFAAWNKFSQNEQTNLKKLEKKEFIDEINKKVNVSQSKTITLTSNNGQNIEVVLSARQFAAWNKLNNEQQEKLKNSSSGEADFLKRINQEVKQARRGVSLNNGESFILPTNLASVWKRLEPHVQASLRAGSSQDSVQALQKLRIQESLTKKRENRARKHLDKEGKGCSESLDKAIDLAAAPTDINLEDERFSDTTKGIEEELSQLAESSSIQEHSEEEDLTITSEYRLPLKKRKIQAEIKKEPIIHFLEEENNLGSSMESVTLEPIAKKQKVNSPFIL